MYDKDQLDKMFAHVQEEMDKQGKRVIENLTAMWAAMDEFRSGPSDKPADLVYSSAEDEEESPVKSMYSQPLDQFFREVEKERAYQDEKWGSDFDAENDRDNWIAYMVSYLGRVFTADSQEAQQKALVQVATLAAAAHEWSSRGMPKTHYGA